MTMAVVDVVRTMGPRIFRRVDGSGSDGDDRGHIQRTSVLLTRCTFVMTTTGTYGWSPGFWSETVVTMDS